MRRIGHVLLGLVIAASGLATFSATGAAASPAPGTLTATGFIHRQDRQIIGVNGKPILLKGVAFGNWLFWESGLMGSRIQTNIGETGLLQNLAGLVGQQRADQFVAQVYDNYITKADFQQVASLGFNSVRIPISDRLLEDPAHPGAYNSSGWQRLDDAVAWAQQAGIYVIFDLHAAPGGQSPLYISDPPPGGAQLWKNAGDQARTVQLWTAIAARYHNNPWVAGYDLLNEPLPPNGKVLDSLYQRIIAGIRSVDTNHLIFLEGMDFASDSTIFRSRYDNNMAISFHQYMWASALLEFKLKLAEHDSARLDVPLWVGEMGDDNYAHTANRVVRYDSDPAISGWSFWAWKTATQLLGARMVKQFTPTPDWQKTIDWIARASTDRPTPAEAEQGLQDYITLIKTAPADPQTIAALHTPTPVPGTGTGLTGQYFADSTFTNRVLVRTDPQINFNWGNGAPARRMPKNNFSIRWTGFIQPFFSETYTFTTVADNSAKLWIGSTLVVDNSTGFGKHAKSGNITLQAGQYYPIRIDYVEKANKASISLSWQSPTQSPGIVPTSQLYPG